MKPNYAPRVMALDDESLERFVASWISKRKDAYPDSHRWSGPGDKGRDVVGYKTTSRHEGGWDNFQCKQLSSKLSERTAINELGKIFMHAANGSYSLPDGYTFVSPRGVVRNVTDYLAHPERFRKACIDKWDEYCKNDLIENQNVDLTPSIKSMIQKFDFKNVHSLTAATLVDDPFIKSTLVEWFDADPGSAPVGIAPDQIQVEESAYLQQLVSAYSQRESFDNCE